MTLSRFAYTLLLIIYCITGFSQDMNTKLKKLKKMEKDSIVQIAIDKINDTSVLVSKNDFDKVCVFANNTNLYVSFYNPIKFLPPETAFIFDVSVDLINDIISYSPLYNMKNTGDIEKYVEDIPHYSRSDESEKHIQFVINAINKSNEVGSFERDAFDNSMIIREKKKFYDITVVSEYQESFYKIDKISRDIYDARHAHLEPEPTYNDNSDEFIERK